MPSKTALMYIFSGLFIIIGCVLLAIAIRFLVDMSISGETSNFTLPVFALVLAISSIVVGAIWWRNTRLSQRRINHE